jgi:hypothetical protein
MIKFLLHVIPELQLHLQAGWTSVNNGTSCFI